MAAGPSGEDSASNWAATAVTCCSSFDSCAVACWDVAVGSSDSLAEGFRSAVVALVADAVDVVERFVLKNGEN